MHQGKKKKKKNESDDWEGIIFQMSERAWAGNILGQW